MIDMSGNFRRTFYGSMLSVLFIISNLIGLKYTNFGSMILSVNFITIPFIFLMILLLDNICNKKEANNAVLSALTIQIIMFFIYLLVVKLGMQSLIPDYANSINEVFNIDATNILSSSIALLISSYVLQYIYEYFKMIKYQFIGVVLSTLSALILYGGITIPIINYGFGLEIIINIILCYLFVTIVMTSLIVLLFYLLKDKEYPSSENKIFIQSVNISIPQNMQDKPIDEVIQIIDKDKKKNKKNSKKKPSKKVKSRSDNSVK